MSNDVFAQIKETVAIIEVARLYGLRVSDKGKALCPFHAEKTPSMSFKGQYFKCFGCGEGGDVIKLVQRLLDLSRPIDAAKRINDDFGLGLTFGQARKRSGNPYGLPDREYRVLVDAARRARYGI